MEDLFYFTKSTVRLEDIGTIASEQGYLLEYVKLDSGLNLNLMDSNGLKSTWWIFGTDYSPFELLPKRRIETYQPASSLVATYPMNGLPYLVPLLERTLRSYGGWIGLDDDMLVVYDISNIQKLLII